VSIHYNIIESDQPFLQQILNKLDGHTAQDAVECLDLIILVDGSN